MLASTIIPALIPKKLSGISNKNNFFEEIKKDILNYLKNKLSAI